MHLRRSPSSAPFGGTFPPAWGSLIKNPRPGTEFSLRLRGTSFPLYRPSEKRLTIVGLTFIIEKNVLLKRRISYESGKSSVPAAGAPQPVPVWRGHEPPAGGQPRCGVEGHRGPAAGGVCDLLRPQPGLLSPVRPRPGAGGGAGRPPGGLPGGQSAGLPGCHRLHQYRVQAPGHGGGPGGAGGAGRGADRGPGPPGPELSVPPGLRTLSVRPAAPPCGALRRHRLHRLGGGGRV